MFLVPRGSPSRLMGIVPYDHALTRRTFRQASAAIVGSNLVSLLRRVYAVRNRSLRFLVELVVADVFQACVSFISFGAFLFRCCCCLFCEIVELSIKLIVTRGYVRCGKTECLSDDSTVCWYEDKSNLRVQGEGDVPRLLEGLQDGLGVALLRGQAIRPTFTYKPGDNAKTPRR